MQWTTEQLIDFVREMLGNEADSERSATCDLHHLIDADDAPPFLDGASLSIDEVQAMHAQSEQILQA